MSDPMLAEAIGLRGQGGDRIEADVARPLAHGPCGGVVVIHRTSGFDEATKEITRRLAVNGYNAMCPQSSWSASDAPSHGISLSPDEKRLYVMDAALDQLEMYDVSGLPTSAPTFVATVPLSSFSGTEHPVSHSSNGKAGY